MPNPERYAELQTLMLQALADPNPVARCLADGVSAVDVPLLERIGEELHQSPKPLCHLPRLAGKLLEHLGQEQ
ncbi:MAG: hypothetical protein ACAI44_39180 [Candidatus Sericytochromatia bacterium]